MILPLWFQILVGVLNWIISGITAGGLVYIADPNTHAACVAGIVAMLNHWRTNPLRFNQLSRANDN